MRSSSWAEVLEPAFVGLTEGVPIGVLYLLVEIVGGTPVSIDPLGFIVVAALGAAAGTRLDRLGAARWQVITVASAVIGVAGTLVSAGVLQTALTGRLGDAFVAHPGGWLLGLAAFRGMVGAGSLEDPDRAGGPFVRGVIVLTAAWLYGGLLGQANQEAFRSAAIGPTLFFATAGIGAIGLRRVHAVAVPAGIQWWRNRTWLITIAILVGLLALAFPAGAELSTVVPGILGLAGFPEVIVFVLFVAWIVSARNVPRVRRRTTIRSFIGLAVFLGIGWVIYQVLHSNANPPAASSGTPRPGFSNTSTGVLGIAIVVAVLAGLALAAILLARGRRTASRMPEAGQVEDDASFEAERPGLGWLRRARRRLFGDKGPKRPVTAEAAYVATLDLLDPLRGLRRLPTETPKAHAHRVREAGGGTLELDLLAADYELSRWGARTLPPRETRRAIGRWERSQGWIAERIQAEEAARLHAEERVGDHA